MIKAYGVIVYFDLQTLSFRLPKKKQFLNLRDQKLYKLSLCFLVQCEDETSQTVSLSTGKLKLHFFCLVLSQDNPFQRPFRTLLMKNWMNPEFEDCLLQDFKIADMGMNLLRVIHTVGTL